MTTFRTSVGPFKYFTGIESLAQIATRDDRVTRPHIHGLHVCSEPYLGIGDGLAITILNQDDHCI